MMLHMHSVLFQVIFLTETDKNLMTLQTGLMHFI